MLLVAAFLPLLDIFTRPSSPEKAWLLGLSAARLAIAILQSIFFLFCIIMVVLLRVAPNRYQQITARAKQLSSNQAALSAGLCFWAAVFLGGLLLYYRFAIAPNVINLAPRLGLLLPALCAYLDRLWAVLMFAAFCMACWTIYVVWVLKQPLFSNASLLAGSGAAVLSIFATIFQWGVFILQLHVFEQIPGWYWPIILKPDLPRHAVVFGFLLLFVLIILYLIKRFPRAYLLNLGLTCLALIGMQVAIGFMEGRGIASLADRFFLSYHRIYTEEACNASFSATDAIIHYEELPPNRFLQTKPPGVLWISFELTQAASLPGLSSILDRLAGIINLSKFLPTMASPVCQRSMVLNTLLFPVLAISTIWMIYIFSRRLIGGAEYLRIASYSAVLFVLAPNVIMLSLFLDQAVYPALFLLVAGGMLLAMQRKSFSACFLMGAILYGAIFITFSMLPLLLVPVIYFICTAWLENNNLLALWGNFKKTLLPMGLGGLLSIVLFKLFLNYDILTRYQRMMATHIGDDFYTRLGLSFTGDPTLLEKIHQTWSAAFLNNVELAAAIGFPVFIFFVVMGIRSLLHVIRRKPETVDAINASLFLTYAALNVSRAILGEVGRLWIFWLPIMAILAVQYLLPVIQRRRWIVFVLVVMQIITLFFTYQFQDYLMPRLLR